MITTLDKLKDLYIYKDKQLISNGKNKRKDTVIYYLSNDNDINEFIDSSLFVSQYIRAYYTPKVFNSSIVKRNKRQNQMEILKNAKSDISSVTLAKPKIQQLNNLNFYYDMKFENDAFFEFVRTSGKARLGMYKAFLAELLSKVTYGEKVLYIKLNDGFESSKANNPAKLIYDMIYYKLMQPSDFAGIKFIFHSPKQNMFFKVSNIGSVNFPRFKNFLNILNKLETNGDLSPDELMIYQNEINTPSVVEEETLEGKKDNLKKSVMNKIKKGLHLDPKIHAITGEDKADIQKLEDKIDDVLDEKHKDGMDEKELEKELENNEEFMNYLADIEEEKATAKKQKARDKAINRLELKQSKVVLGETKIDDLLADFDAKSIDITEMPVDTIHDEIKVSKLNDFDVSYNKNQKEKDLAAVISAFNDDPDLPMYITKITREDTSDEFNKKETMTVNYEDANGVKHTFKLDVPLLIDERFMYLNGGKKAISKQLFLLPIVKTTSKQTDAVQITTNYNKMFLMRYGQKLDPNVEKFKKHIIANPKDTNIKAVLGDNSLVNKTFLSTLEYDEFSKFLMKLTIGKYYFRFNRQDIIDEVETKGIVNDIETAVAEDEFVVGYIGKKLIIIDKKDNKVYSKEQKGTKVTKTFMYNSITECLIELMSEVSGKDYYAKVMENSTGKRFVYSRASILGKKVPLILLLGLYNGLEETLVRYEVPYEFNKKRRRLTPKEKAEWNVVTFKDGYLYYPINPLRYPLLLNGLVEANTKEYTFEEFSKDETYTRLFSEMYGSANMTKGLKNFLTLIIDPITKDILSELDLPTNIVDLLLYGNTLLENTGYRELNDMKNYRIRSNEIINARIYNILANQYKVYKDTSKAGHPIKVTVPQDRLIRELIESPLVDEYSILNPIAEAEKIGNCTYKGLSGTNLDDAFTTQMRSYDKTMLGFLGLNTPDSAKVGMVRQMTYNPKIINNRGIIDTDVTVKDLKAGDMLTPAELLSSFTSTHADPPRVGMQVTQSKHIIPTEVQHKPLFGSGMEKTLPHILGNDFVFKATQDGKVEKVDEKNELMIIRYKDGTMDTVDLSPVQAKNSNGGFWITNKKEPSVKEGASFKKGNIIAKNPQYFHGGKDDTTYVTGHLSKVAIASGDYTYEDSCLSTPKLSKNMASLITMKKPVNLGVNTNIDFLVKKGTKVKTGDKLIIFEHSFDEADANKLLDQLGDEFSEVIEEMSKNMVTTKYTGEVVDIKIYYNRPLEDFQPSVQKLIKSYNSSINSKKKIVKDTYGEHYEKNSFIFPPSQQVNNDKIGGEDVDGIMIELYVRYEDHLFVGDKIAFNTALKSIIATVTDEGEEPYSSYREEEKIDAVVSPLSIVSRMTTDVFNQLWLNKVLIELKNEVGSILDE